MNLKKHLQSISLPVFVAVILFGMSSWIDINGIFVELPLMVDALPEGWNLPSYFVLIIQVANIGPILYTIGHKLFPGKLKEWPVIYVVIGIGAAASFLLIFFWDSTSNIDGEARSTALLTLAAFLALVDCTSSVVFLPYMAYIKEQYMSAFYIGEGFSGLVPGLLGLAQGVGGNPTCVNTSSGENDTDWAMFPQYQPARFSVDIFFVCIFALMCVSGVSFSFLHFAPCCSKAKVESHYDCDVTQGQDNAGLEHDCLDDRIKSISFTTTQDICYQSQNDEAHKVPIAKEEKERPPSSETSETTKHDTRSLTLCQFVVLLVYLGFVNAMTNGVLVSILSYACLPYGSEAYGYATRLSTIINPIACLFSLFVPRVSIAITSVLVAIGTVLSAYVMYLAIKSPTPPLQDDTTGTVLVVVAYVVLVALFSYTKVAIATACRDDGGRISLLWCGGITQVGSFIGAVVIFICINVLELFESAPACP